MLSSFIILDNALFDLTPNEVVQNGTSAFEIPCSIFDIRWTSRMSNTESQMSKCFLVSLAYSEESRVMAPLLLSGEGAGG